jgi:hypothetical protein
MMMGASKMGFGNKTPKKPQEPAAATSSRNSLTQKSQELERKK